ncbi:MAG: hypothetical protein KGV44_06320 [Flavobacteriaceae bacterium]|nr:hypothetical protein [Flavobacteriaceae bacterium]
MELIVGIIVGLIVFAIIGYFLYSYVEENYGYNIFNFWVLVRGVLSIISLYFGFALEYNTMLFTLSGVLLLWSFIETWRKTNIFIALISFIFQLVASILAYELLNKLIKILKGEY